MSFESLNKDELAKVAEFFQKDILVADEDKGPTKKELIASLASDADSEAVSWEDYKTLYLADNGNVVEGNAEEVVDDEVSNPVPDENTVQADDLAVQPVAVDVDAAAINVDAVDVVDDEEEEEEEVLLKMDRKNGTFSTHGLMFTKQHPFKSVPATVAEEILRDVPGFRQALPSEVKDYYN